MDFCLLPAEISEFILKVLSAIWNNGIGKIEEECGIRNESLLRPLTLNFCVYNFMIQSTLFKFMIFSSNSICFFISLVFFITPCKKLKCLI